MRHYIDLHCDTISVLERHSEYGELNENRGQADIKRLLQAGCACQIFACFIEKSDFAGADGWDAGYCYAHRLLDVLHGEIEKNSETTASALCAADISANEALGKISALASVEEGYAHRLLDVLHGEIEKNSETTASALCAADISANEALGKISALASVEEGGILNEDMGRLDALYERGVRLMTLTWNFENCIGYPNSDISAVMRKGLKPFGHEVVERMQDKGMIVDVSHLSDGGFYDVAGHAKKCVSAVMRKGLKPFGHEVVERMQDKGMIVDVSHLSDGGFYDVAGHAKKCGIPFAASHSSARALTGHPRNLTDEMLKIIGETGSVAGVNFFHKFTSDSGYSSVADIVRHVLYMVDKAGEDAVAIGSDFDGMDDCLEITGAQKMPLLFDALKKAHLTEAVIDKICYGNAMRLFKSVLHP